MEHSNKTIDESQWHICPGKQSNNEDEKVSEDGEKAERGPSARSGELLIGVQSFVERKPIEIAVLEPTSAGQATCDNAVERNNGKIKGVKNVFSNSKTRIFSSK